MKSTQVKTWFIGSVIAAVYVYTVAPALVFGPGKIEKRTREPRIVNAMVQR